MSKSNSGADTAVDVVAELRRLGERLVALERHVFEQDKEMLALSRQLEQLRGALLGLRERLSEPSGNQGASAANVYGDERPPHY